MHRLRISLPKLCLGTSLLVLGSSGVALAQGDVASLKVDVDGDGKLDRLVLDSAGTISIHIQGRPTDGAWTPLAASGQVFSGTFQLDRKIDPAGRPLILASAKMRTSKGVHEEALVVAWTAGKFTPLWRGPTGTQGASFISLELGKYGLIRYASQHGVSRCDKKTAHLDAQRFDFTRQRFRPASQAVRVDAQAPVLLAQGKPIHQRWQHMRPPWFRPQSSSSSTLAPTAAQLVAPLALSDGDPATAWVENKNGAGRGEFVTLRSSIGALEIHGLRLILGHQGASASHLRPKRLGLLIGQTPYWIDVKPGGSEALWVQLPKPVASDCVTLIIDQVYGDKKGGAHTAISEVDIFSDQDLDRSAAGAFLAKRIAAGKGSADRGRLLEALGVAVEPALVHAIEQSKDPSARTRLRLALAAIPANAPQLVAGLPMASRGEEMQFTQALLELGTKSLPSLFLALRSAHSAEGIERLLKVVSRIDAPENTEHLIQLCELENRNLQRALAQTLGRRPGAIARVIHTLSTLPPSATQVATLYRTLGVALHSLPVSSPERVAIEDVIAEALASSLAQNSTFSFETKERLLESAAGVPRLQEALRAQVTSRMQSSQAPELALLRIASSSLARTIDTSDELRAFIATTLSHPDPGVRLAVLQELPQGTQQEQLAQLLRQDRWPEVRRAVAASLARTCTARSGEVLTTAAQQDRDSQVAKTALVSLVQCQSPGLFAALSKVLDTKKRPIEARLYAARHLGNRVSTIQASQVLARYRRTRGRALIDLTQRKIISALTVSLADIGTAAAAKELYRSALDPAVPELQIAALRALRRDCMAGAREAGAKLRQSATTSVAMAARQNADRCSVQP